MGWTNPFKPITSPVGYTPTSSTPSSTPDSNSLGNNTSSPYIPRTNDPILPSEKQEIADLSIERDKKIQPKDVTWWERLLPEWVVQYLGRKDRIIKEKPTTTEAVTPAKPLPEPQKEEIGVVETIVETIKKPIINLASRLRQWLNL